MWRDGIKQYGAKALHEPAIYRNGNFWIGNGLTSLSCKMYMDTRAAAVVMVKHIVNCISRKRPRMTVKITMLVSERISRFGCGIAQG